MIIFLYGTNTFRSRRQLKKMMVKFKADRDPQGLNVVSLDAEKTEPGKIMEQVLAVPFLAEKRMVVIENLLVSKNQDLMSELIKRIKEKNIFEATVLVFWEGTDPSTGSGRVKTKVAKELFACLEKEKYAQSFGELSGVKLSAWIDSEVKERGGEIEKNAVQYLVQHVGSDMWRLNSLIDQLISYSERSEAESPPKADPSSGGEEFFKTDVENVIATNSKPTLEVSKDPLTRPLASLRINLADTQLFLDEKADDNIFNLVDAIAGKQPKAVYQMIQEQYQNGEDAQYIFAMILRQFRILLEMRDLFERDDAVQSNILAQKLGLHPFVVKKSLPLVKRYSMNELKLVYEQLLELDVQTKTGHGDERVLLDIFVGRVGAE